ncbi:Trk system potassium transporter TrkA [Leucothrix sargassi]|nr:Trk system potassium transporter TrkA [Leucothrix sargassi]
MNIVIIGAGQVGSSLAASLATEDNDVVVIDKNAERLRHLREKLDIDTFQGNASQPDVLESANVVNADMIIAVTSSDEVNMIACQVAFLLFRTPTKIARVRSISYLDHKELFSKDAIPIDVLISPERLITEYVYQLMSHPGALQVLEFAKKKVKLVAVRAQFGGKLIDHEIRDFAEHIPDVDVRVVAIFRKGKAILPDGDTVIEVDDEIFVIASSQHIRVVMSELSTVEKPYKKIMIAGGGNVGGNLASLLEKERYQVKIIEQDPDTAGYLAEKLDRTLVLEGDAADEHLLQEEDISNIDVFCAVTNDDEANILSAMLAKRLGVRKVMALVNRPSYVDLVESGIIDMAISPQQVTLSGLLAHVRQGDIVSVHALRKGAAEVLEVVAHGDENTSRVVGRSLEQLKLPPGSTVCAVVKGSHVVLPNSEVIIEENDHVIIFLSDKRYIRVIEKMFQVGMGYI